LESHVTREQISDFCIASMANVLRIPKSNVATDIKFSRLGLDSAVVICVMMELDGLSGQLAEKRAARSSA